MARSSDRSALYRRGKSPFWWCRYRGSDGELRRESTGCKDAEAAILRWRQLEREAMGAAGPAAATTTVTDAIERMIAGCRAKGLATATIGFYEEKARHFCTHFGAHSDLRRSVTARSVDAFIESRTPFASQHTIAKELTTLRIVLKVARRRGEFDLDPAQVLPVAFATGYEPRKTTLTPNQVALLLKHIRDPGFAAWIAFSIATGARKSEINRAIAADIDFAAGHVYLRGTKTEKSKRFVPVLPPTKPLLERALRDGDGTDRLFVRRDNPLTQLTDACARAGVPRVSTNDLRRTFATDLEERGVPHESIARLLGHTTTTMVEKVYGRGRPEVLLASVSDLYRNNRNQTPEREQQEVNQPDFLRARPDSNGRPADSKTRGFDRENESDRDAAAPSVLDLHGEPPALVPDGSDIEAPFVGRPAALQANRALRKCLLAATSYPADELALRRTRGAS